MVRCEKNEKNKKTHQVTHSSIIAMCIKHIEGHM